MVNLTEFFGEPIAVYTHEDAVSDGVIIRLDDKEQHNTDCNQFYPNMPIYITKALYDQHKNNAERIARSDNDEVSRLLGLSIYDMLNMSFYMLCYYKRSGKLENLNKINFEYHLQKDKFCFSEEKTLSVMMSNLDGKGKPFFLFMRPEDD